MGEIRYEFRLAEYGFLFSVAVRGSVAVDAGLASGNPRYVDLDAATKFDGGDVKFGVRDGGPQVELVSRRAALEAAKRISTQMNRENAALGGCRAVDWARPTQLAAARIRRDEAQQFENVAHRNHLPNRLEIDAWQESRSRKPPQLVSHPPDRAPGTETRNP